MTKSTPRGLDLALRFENKSRVNNDNNTKTTRYEMFNSNYSAYSLLLKTCRVLIGSFFVHKNRFFPNRKTFKRDKSVSKCTRAHRNTYGAYFSTKMRMLIVSRDEDAGNWVYIKLLRHTQGEYTVMISKNTGLVRVSPELLRPLLSLEAKAALVTRRIYFSDIYGIDVVKSCVKAFHRLGKTGST